jgi:hypothetical protein
MTEQLENSPLPPPSSEVTGFLHLIQSQIRQLISIPLRQ